MILRFQHSTQTCAKYLLLLQAKSPYHRRHSNSFYSPTHTFTHIHIVTQWNAQTAIDLPTYLSLSRSRSACFYRPKWEPSHTQCATGTYSRFPKVRSNFIVIIRSYTWEEKKIELILTRIHYFSAHWNVWKKIHNTHTHTHTDTHKFIHNAR